MRRRLVRIARILSLLLCIAATALWVRSYWRCYDIEWSDGSLASSRGILFYEFSFLSGAGPQRGMHFHSLQVFYRPPRFSGPNYLYFHFAGIAFARGGRHILLFAVPFWAIVTLAASLSLALKSLSADRRRSKEQVCHFCGYNLTGNVSGTCPECGTKIPQKFSRLPRRLST